MSHALRDDAGLAVEDDASSPSDGAPLRAPVCPPLPSGTPRLLARYEGISSSLVVEGDSVYYGVDAITEEPWRDPGTNGVWRVDRAGSEPSRAIAMRGAPNTFVLDERAMYYTVPWQVRRLSRTGGAAETLFTNLEFGGSPIALVGDRVLFVEAGARLVSGSTRGGAVTPFAGLEPGVGPFIVSEGEIVFGFQGFAVSHAESEPPTAIGALPSRGGPVRWIADSDGVPRHIAADARSVYWTVFERPAVWRAPRSGGPVERVTRWLGLPGALAVHDGDVYVVDVPAPFSPSPDVRLLRWRSCDERPAMVIDHVPTSRIVDLDVALTISGDEVFWVGAGEVRAVPR